MIVLNKSGIQKEYIEQVNEILKKCRDDLEKVMSEYDFEGDPFEEADNTLWDLGRCLEGDLPIRRSEL